LVTYTKTDNTYISSYKPFTQSSKTINISISQHLTLLYGQKLPNYSYQYHCYSVHLNLNCPVFCSCAVTIAPCCAWATDLHQNLYNISMTW